MGSLDRKVLRDKIDELLVAAVEFKAVEDVIKEKGSSPYLREQKALKEAYFDSLFDDLKNYLGDDDKRELFLRFLRDVTIGGPYSDDLPDRLAEFVLDKKATNPGQQETLAEGGWNVAMEAYRLMQEENLTMTEAVDRLKANMTPEEQQATLHGLEILYASLDAEEERGES